MQYFSDLLWNLPNRRASAVSNRTGRTYPDLQRSKRNIRRGPDRGGRVRERVQENSIPIGRWARSERASYEPIEFPRILMRFTEHKKHYRTFQEARKRPPLDRSPAVSLSLLALPRCGHHRPKTLLTLSHHLRPHVRQTTVPRNETTGEHFDSRWGRPSRDRSASNDNHPPRIQNPAGGSGRAAMLEC